MNIQATAPAIAAKPRKVSTGSNIREYGLMIALVVIMIFFQFTTNGALFKPVNLTNLILQNSYIIIMALGMLCVIVAGFIDLSVGSVAGFIGALAAILMVRYGVSYQLVGIVCVITGGAIGAAQGYWVAFHKIPSFIVTLAGMLVFRGLTLALLGGNSVGPFAIGFQQLSSGFIQDFSGLKGFNVTTMVIGAVVAAGMFYGSLRNRLNREKHGFQGGPFGFFVLENGILSGLLLLLTYQLASYKGYPNVLIVMGVLIALFAFITTRTTIGRRIYALGGNEKAAKLSGVKTERLAFLTFVTMGALAALAGLVFTARLNTATPKAGVGFELDVIAAVFIGGASASGGVGKVMGAVIGAFIMGVLNNGMSIMGVGIDWQQVVKGLVLLAAVIFDVYNKNKG
jgi:putative multiple sugar transport system permease protein